jgi:hypothetical protein
MDYNRVFRFTIIGAVVLACSILLLALLQQLLVPILVWFIPSLETLFYDLAFFGAYRTQSFISFNLSAPQPSVVRWDASCDSGYVFIDPSGPAPDHRGPVILDARGNLVWTSDQYETTTNSRIQKYDGKEYLTFWAGQKAKTSGTGSYYMLDSSYQVYKKIDAVGEDLHGDLHEFKITEQGTALLTAYTPVQVDLTPMGWFRTKQGWIVDNIFQEVDLATGELLFEWRASDHFRAEDSYMTNPVGGYVKSIPFDFFHINSIEKDFQGNYLISSRHFHAVYLINGTSGEVIWGLGGHTDDFMDLSNGAASDFSWQHDARWLNREDGVISLFDNSYAWPHSNAPNSQGRIIQLDFEKRTAKLLHSFVSLQHARSSSQGSVQLLPAAHGEPHIFIGWGSSAAFGEFTQDGHLLCETHFAASALFWWEKVKSYRAFKALSWTAIPAAWDPHAKIDSNEMFVSWNGATEVAYWELQAQEASESEFDGQGWEVIDIIEKDAFEESFPLPKDVHYAHYRVAALDAQRNVLRYSNITKPPTGSVLSYVLAGISAILCMAAVIGFWLFRRRGFHAEWRKYAQFTIDRSKYTKLW